MYFVFQSLGSPKILQKTDFTLKVSKFLEMTENLNEVGVFVSMFAIIMSAKELEYQMFQKIQK